MKKTLYLVVLSALLSIGGAALAADPAPTNPPAAPEKKADAKKPAKSRPVPYKGEVKAVDDSAKTFTIGERVFQVTSTTKITKDGKPAIFADIKVGEAVRGSGSTGADGKWSAQSVTIGAKKTEESTPKKGTKNEAQPKKDQPQPPK